MSDVAGESFEPLELVVSKPAEARSVVHRPPRLREDIVGRSRLVERVLAPGPRMTLITGPAGAGKSVLLAECHEACEKPAWLSIEPAQADPVVLWVSILTSLDWSLGRVAVDARRRLATAGPLVLDSVVDDVLGALEERDVGLDLFIDDLHLLDDDVGLQSVHRFVRHLPFGTRVIATSRTRSPLPTARLRAEGELREISGGQLAFTGEETAEVARRMGVELQPPVVERLVDTTEGWAAGIRLATMAADADGDVAEALFSFTGSHQAVAEYLVAEVLEGLPQDDRRFLEETSVLDRLAGGICDAVTASTGAAERLASLERANAFVISLDPSGESFRYHHLFHQLLESRLARRSTGEICELHDRAFEWYRANGHVIAAVHHGLAAGRETDAADLLCASWLELVSTGRLATARRLAVSFDRRDILGYRPLAVAAAHLAGLSGIQREARVYLRAAEEADHSGPPPDGMASMEGSLAMARGTLALDGVGPALADARFAYAGEPPHSPWRPLAALVIGLAEVMRGETEEAARYLEEAAVAEDAAVRAYGLAELAMAHVAHDDLPRAEVLVDQACVLIREAGLQDVIQSASAHAAEALVALAAGDPARAQRALDAAEPPLTLTAGSLPMDAMRAALLLGGVALDLGFPERARRHVDLAADLGREVPDVGVMGDRLIDLEDRLPDSPPPDRPETNAAEFTEREGQILALLPLELTTRELGEEVFLSRNTIKTYLRRIYRKLEVSTREDAVARARVLGLIEELSPPARRRSRSP